MRQPPAEKKKSSTFSMFKPTNLKNLTNALIIFFCIYFRFLFHKQFHLTNQRPKFCLVCQSKYEDENSFYEHVMFAHEQVFEHFCSQCDKSFSTESDLTRHENTHTAQRNYECSECGKRFIDSQTLSEHSVIYIRRRKISKILHSVLYSGRAFSC